ncbi:uncharacterized protein EV422DRAFT_540109 [Fimicolochytrium jonesii]|uniref:uncharacterized protein n=1 Tax=Fimicolochytrium jonesii TaxID=1396493 RepID=UPI0022FE81BA|nr:uncharacterized protein EV422DRAFT_540109 [Fimicolochytrium jonesii]KAI8817824.1 hypothetical protein EV422DRAFT_540109 [Fimicolochytrium jonesii]
MPWATVNPIIPPRAFRRRQPCVLTSPIHPPISHALRFRFTPPLLLHRVPWHLIRGGFSNKNEIRKWVLALGEVANLRPRFQYAHPAPVALGEDMDNPVLSYRSHRRMACDTSVYASLLHLLWFPANTGISKSPAESPPLPLQTATNPYRTSGPTSTASRWQWHHSRLCPPSRPAPPHDRPSPPRRVFWAFAATPGLPDTCTASFGRFSRLARLAFSTFAPTLPIHRKPCILKSSNLSPINPNPKARSVRTSHTVSSSPVIVVHPLIGCAVRLLLNFQSVMGSEGLVRWGRSNHDGSI